MTKDGSTNTKAPVKQLSPPNVFKMKSVQPFFFGSVHCLHRNQHKAKLQAKLHFSSAMNGIKLHETNEKKKKPKQKTNQQTKKQKKKPQKTPNIASKI